MHTSTRTLFWRRQDQLAGKSTHSLTKKSVPELNDQPTYIYILFHFNCYHLWVLFVTTATWLPQITYWHSKGSVCLHIYIIKVWALNLLKKSLCTCSIVPWKNKPHQKYLTTITWKVLEWQVTELCRIIVYLILCCFIFWQGWTQMPTWPYFPLHLIVAVFCFYS